MIPVTTIFIATVAVSAAPLDEVQPNGIVYRHFDHALMAKIKAKSAADKDAKRRYDPVTWLPIEAEKPARVRRPRPDDSSIRARRMAMAAMRKQKQRQRSSYDPLWWITAPAVPMKPCPMAWMYYASRMSY